MGHGQSNGTTSEAPLRPTMPDTVDLAHAIELLQEAALVLTWEPNWFGPTIDDCRTLHVNDRARMALAATWSDLPNRRLSDIMPAGTAAAVHGLCVAALHTERPIEHFALAPDPITDLSGTASVAVWVTRVGDAVVCVWLAGQLDIGDEVDRLAATSTALDQIDPTSQSDTPTGVDLGVFSLNLMTGTLIWSAGLYEIFARTHQDGPLDVTDWPMPTGSESSLHDPWLALIHDGAPMDVEVSLIPLLGHQLRVVANALIGPDGRPTMVHGRCRVIDP
jgi:hypothetical protein